MAYEKIKKLVKEKYGKDIDDEEAQKILKDISADGELSDEQLEAAAGGINLSIDYWEPKIV